MTTLPFARTLQFHLPYDRGLDVLTLQRQIGGGADGVFGPQTDRALRAWQTQQGLPSTGVCDLATWTRLFPDTGAANSNRLSALVARLRSDHSRFDGGYSWKLGAGGISVDGHPPEGSGGEPKTVTAIWAEFEAPVRQWSTQFGVPAELILATIATESSGKPLAIRFEPKYQSDDATPGQVSPGLMQTLLSTAREAVGNPTIDRTWLFQPSNSIHAGTAYILRQAQHTGFDPPVVACCYNAGSVVLNDSPANRWRMRQYPIGTSAHCDRFVGWFNDAMTVLGRLPTPPQTSFTAMVR